MKQPGPLLALALLTSCPELARAACAAGTQLSTCIDVDVLWPHAGPSRFAFVGSATTTPSGELGVAVVTTYLARPLVLRVPGSTVEGNEIAAVAKLWDTTLLWSLGVTPAIDLDLALPFTVYRSGTGISALSAQRTAELSRTAVRDARVGATFTLTRGRTHGGLSYAGATRLELALPTGQSSSFAGDRFAVMIPSTSAELGYRRFLFAAEIGARMRALSELAGTRVGTQIVGSVGVAAQVLGDDALSLQIEAITLPTLAAQHDVERVNGQAARAISGARPALVPTEWQVSLRTGALLGGDGSISLGAGGPLAPSGEYGVTAPAYRFVLALRYAPRATPR